MDESLFTLRDLARVCGIPERRVQYWVRTGVLAPSVERNGRRFFTFQDLISAKTAKELIESGVSLQAVRKNLSALRTALPTAGGSLRGLRVVSDGDRLVVLGADAPFEPTSGQVVMDFAVG